MQICMSILYLPKGLCAHIFCALPIFLEEGGIAEHTQHENTLHVYFSLHDLQVLFFNKAIEESDSFIVP